MSKINLSLLPLLLFFTLLLMSPPVALHAYDGALPVTIPSASEVGYPPFCIVDENNQADGFAVELLTEVLNKMGHDASFWTGPWLDVKQSLVDRKVRVLPLVGRTPEREAFFDFTSPYMTLHGAIIVRTDERQINSMKDLQGKQVAVMKGDNAEEHVRRQNLGVVVVATNTFEEALRELAEGKHDAVVMQRLLFIQLTKQLGINNLKTVGPPLADFVQSFCFAVAKGDAKLLSILNEGLLIAMADGTFERLRKKWFSPLEEAQKDSLVVGGDSNYPPYEFLDENGQPAGYNVELTKAIAKQLGIKVEFQLGQWVQVKEKLANREIDLLQGMFYTTERAKTFAFTDGHTLVGHVAVVRNGSAIPQGMSDLAGKTIIVMNGDIMHDLAIQAGLSGQLILAEDQKNALEMLSEGRGDCALIARLPAMYWIKKANLSNLSVGEESFASPEYCYASYRDNKELIDHFSLALRVLESTGEYRKIHQKWLGVYDNQGPDYWSVVKYLLYVTVPILLVLLATVLWSQSLKKQVQTRTRELKESEEKAHLVLDSTAEAIYGLDKSGNCTFCNQSFLEMLGYSSEEELLGRNMHHLIHHTTEEGLPNSVENCRIINSFQKGENVHIEADQLWKADGTSFTAEIWSHPIQKEDVVIGAVVTFVDISSRKRLEEELHHQTTQLEKELTERKMAEKALQNQTVVLAGEIEERRRAEQSLLQSEATIRNKLKVILEPEGDISTLELSDIIDCEMLQALMDDFYKITGILGAVLDISGNLLVAVGWQDICTKFHRCHPETLKNCIESDMALTNDVPFGTFRKYRCKNNMWDMVTPLEVGGRHAGNIFIGQFFYEDETIDREMFREQARLYGFDEKEYLEALDRVPRFSQEVVETGMKFYAKLTEIISTLSFSSIKLSRMLSEHRHLEEQLHQSQKIESLGRLAGGVAHDYNNMLSVIIGNVELGQMKIEQFAPVSHNLEQILQAANRSRDITRQLLAFARKQIINPKVLDLDIAVESMLMMLRNLLGENINLVWKPHGNLWPVKVDPSQLDQVLANLCINARDSIADVGKMTIETDTVSFDEDYCKDHRGFIIGDFVMFAVSDDGCGMDSEILNNIFEPFFTTKQVGEGSGLGLATVYGIVKQGNGFINVYSEPGQGTTFKIYLPRCEESETVKQEAVTAEVFKGQGETVLLVEDEAAIITLATAMLEDLGYHVLAANSPVEALSLVETHQGEIHLLLTDVVMPGMNGRDLAKQVQEMYPEMKTLYMSGYTANVIAHHGVLDEGIHFIQKPFARSDLSIRIREALNSKA